MATNKQAVLDIIGGGGGTPGTFTIVTLTQGQLVFPTVAVPSVDPNTLDDYEEGSFVPTISGTATAGVGTYSIQEGVYTKIGNMVFVNISLTWSAHTGTGNMRIVGLPFTSSTTAAAVGNVLGSVLVYPAQLTCTILPSTTQVQLRTFASGVGSAELAIDTAAVINCSIAYRTGA